MRHFISTLLICATACLYAQTVTGTITNASCYGIADGAIDITVLDDPGTYSYTWTGPNGFYVGSEDVSGLLAGDYTVTIVNIIADFIEEIAIETFTVLEPSAIEISYILIEESCYGSNDGSIDISVTGGEGNYTFLWSNGSTSEDIAGLQGGIPGLGSGEYSVTVIDESACQVSHAYMMSEAFTVSYEVNTVNSNCGNSDGAAEITAYEGNLEITWSIGETGLMVENLSSGMYSVEVFEVDSGCSTVKYFYIEDNSGVIITEQTANASCYDCNDGQISLDISGGQAPYNVQWANEVAGFENDNLLPGSYSATVTDAVGCVNNICVSVSNMTPLRVSSTTTDASGCGMSDGSASVIANDGNMPYTFQWDDSGLQSTQTATNLSAGYYHCTVTDALLQQKIVTVAVGEEGGPLIEVDGSGDAECSLDNGYINVSFTGGTGSYTYLWSEGTINQNLTNVATGEYYLYVRDGACASAQRFEINSSPVVMEQSICLVTVDSSTNHNLVIWENLQAEGIDHYNIYREACSGQFDLIGSVDANAITVFEDVNSLPSIKSYSYRISAVNACGQESKLSSIHKTIHLSLSIDEIAEEAQLIWDDYIGFAHTVFKAYKMVEGFGLTELGEVSNTDYSIIDNNYSGPGVCYMIVVGKQEGACDAWNGNDKASGGPYYQSMSNIEDEGFVNTTKVEDRLSINRSIYPNPASSILNIDSPELIQSIKLFDVTGKLVNSYRNINQNKVRLSVQNFRKGFYVLEIQTSELIQEKLVFE